jgi:hypothetical protein
VVSSKKKSTVMSPIRWTERPTGALVAVNSLWPVEQALEGPVTHNGTASGPAMRKSYANFPPSFSSLARGPSVCTIVTADGSFVVPLEFPSPVLRTVEPAHTPQKIEVLSKSSTHPRKNEVSSNSFHTRKRIEVSSNWFAHLNKFEVSKIPTPFCN